MRPPLRTALVTGASAGIGRELVRRLVADRGMTVLATARRADRLAELRDEFPAGSVMIEAGDLTDPAFRERLWDTAAAAFPGGPDLLLNNAGVGHYSRFEQEDPATIDRILAVNLAAPLDLTRRALPSMIERGSGQILFISSVLGFVGLPYSATYAASKHAINGLVKSLRHELKGSGVVVRAACPNRTVSEFHAAASGDDPGHAPRRARYAEPTERIARAIARGLDRRSAFQYPGLTARWVVGIARWFPGPFDWFMERWSAAHFRDEVERARPIGGVRNSDP